MAYAVKILGCFATFGFGDEMMGVSLRRWDGALTDWANDFNGLLRDGLIQGNQFLANFSNHGVGLATPFNKVMSSS